MDEKRLFELEYERTMKEMRSVFLFFGIVIAALALLKIVFL